MIKILNFKRFFIDVLIKNRKNSIRVGEEYFANMEKALNGDDYCYLMFKILFIPINREALINIRANIERKKKFLVALEKRAANYN